MINAPVLYSYRRCPYAMRARMALIYSQIDFEHREIELRHKPVSMLALSPKGTVPVLVTPDSLVIDQSIDIMYWALAKYDPMQWLPLDLQQRQKIVDEIYRNDLEFKPILDAYKYPDRSRVSQDVSWNKAFEEHLLPMETVLNVQNFLLGDRPSLLDIAVFPFIRQWAGVDSKKFHESTLLSIQRWLNFFLLSDLFHKAMAKYPVWNDQV